MMVVCIEFPAHDACFSHSVLFKVSLNMEVLYRSVAYSVLTLNKLLGSCSKQKKEIDIKTHFSLKNILVYRGLCSVLVKVFATIKMFKLPTLPQPSIEKLPIFDKSLVLFNFEDVNGLKKIGEYIDI